MLFLLFQLDCERYALDASQVAEVLPLVHIKHIPQAPAGVIGVCDYHQTPVPVLDLSRFILGRAAERQLGTRIVLVHYPDEAGVTRLLGLVAEKATQTLRCDPDRFIASGVEHGAAPYLGPVASDAHGMIQRIDVRKLLPPAVREALFQLPASGRERLEA